MEHSFCMLIQYKRNAYSIFNTECLNRRCSILRVPAAAVNKISPAVKRNRKAETAPIGKIIEAITVIADIRQQILLICFVLSDCTDIPLSQYLSAFAE